VWEEPALLDHVAGAPAQTYRIPFRSRFTLNQDLAGTGQEEAVDELESCRLPATRLTQEHQGFTRLDSKTKMGNYLRGRSSMRKTNVAKLYQGLGDGFTHYCSQLEVGKVGAAPVLQANGQQRRQDSQDEQDYLI
jgi:hypothetical protein